VRAAEVEAESTTSLLLEELDQTSMGKEMNSE